jgi:hypothetical protein
MKRFTLRLSTLCLAATAALMVAFSSPGRAQGSAPGIRFTTVDHPGAATTTSLTGINDHDEIVGIYDDYQGHMHAYKGKKGDAHYQSIDYPGAVQTYVFRITNVGEIIGTYFDQAGYQHGFLRLPEKCKDQAARYIPFDFPGAAQNLTFDYELGTGLGTSGFGLNNRGQIVGQYADSDGVGHGFYASEHGFTSFTAPDSNNIPGFLGGSGLAGINDAGNVAGSFCSTNPFDPIFMHGFMLQNGRRTVIDPPGSFLTQVFGINDRDEVSGFYYDAQQLGHGYIYSKNNKNKFLIIDVPGAVYISTVGSVNNSGGFVGEYVDGFGLTHGYIGTRP